MDCPVIDETYSNDWQEQVGRSKVTPPQAQLKVLSQQLMLHIANATHQSLAGAGLGGAEHIAPQQQRRDGARLHLRRQNETLRQDPILQRS